AGVGVEPNYKTKGRGGEKLRGAGPPRAEGEVFYQHPLPAIIDTNVTTFLSGLILFQFGTGPIKGFAVTLCIGILTTVVTAVYMTRIYYDYRVVTRKLTRLSI